MRPFPRPWASHGCRAAALAASLTAVLWTPGVFASELDVSGRWVSVGLNLGVTREHQEAHWLAGGEISAAWIEGATWAGVYVDTLYDSGTGRVRLSMGPEAGFLIFGIDGGYVMELGDRKVRHGVVVRPMIALRWVIPYARLGWRTGDDAGAFAEFGALVKHAF